MVPAIILTILMAFCIHLGPILFANNQQLAIELTKSFRVSELESRNSTIKRGIVLETPLQVIVERRQPRCPQPTTRVKTTTTTTTKRRKTRSFTTTTTSYSTVTTTSSSATTTTTTSIRTTTTSKSTTSPTTTTTTGSPTTTTTTTTTTSDLTTVITPPLPTPTNLKLFVPAYWYPNTDWSTTIDAAASVNYLIVNPNSGPGASLDPTYVSWVQKAQTAGIKVLGYVYTSYGARPLTEVLMEYSNYVSWYNVDGVFLDEVASSVDMVWYYRNVAENIHSGATKGVQKVVVINPGVYPHEEYMGVCDLVLAYEDSFGNYNANSLNELVPSWVGKYSASRFIHYVYGVPSLLLPDAMDLARQFEAGSIYFTDLPLNPNPYSRLPVYFSREVGLL
ncbi:UNVERIFIED_CONTAM: hypothetical protein HDU68_012107 [Siphonaria sp. JEL0065]|nr:hypothetical protein HDU68_012107 [Siphonaria sp. JEL0065]